MIHPRKVLYLSRTGSRAERPSYLNGRVDLQIEEGWAGEHKIECFPRWQLPRLGRLVANVEPLSAIIVTSEESVCSDGHGVDANHTPHGNKQGG